MSDIQYNKSAPVLVTGATGYVASWLVKRLLDEDFVVHAAVRDPSNTEKLTYLNDLAERNQFGKDYPFPTKSLPKWLVWIVGPFLAKNTTRKYIARNVGLPFVADNSKGIRELGLSYRPLETSLGEMFQQLVDNGLVT